MSYVMPTSRQGLRITVAPLHGEGASAIASYARQHKYLVTYRNCTTASYYTTMMSPFGPIDQWTGRLVNRLPAVEPLRYLGIGIGDGRVEDDLKHLFGASICIDAFSGLPPEREFAYDILRRQRSIFHALLPSGDINAVSLPASAYHQLLALFSTYYAEDQADVVRKVAGALRRAGEAFFTIKFHSRAACNVFRALRGAPAIFREHGYDVVAQVAQLQDVQAGFVSLRKLDDGDIGAALLEAIHTVQHAGSGPAPAARPCRFTLDDDPVLMEVDAIRVAVTQEIRRCIAMYTIDPGPVALRNALIVLAKTNYRDVHKNMSSPELVDAIRAVFARSPIVKDTYPAVRLSGNVTEQSTLALDMRNFPLPETIDTESAIAIMTMVLTQASFCNDLAAGFPIRNLVWRALVPVDWEQAHWYGPSGTAHRP